MAILAGFIVAMAVGLTGVGAGSIMAPLLMLGFGMEPAEAVGNALIFAAAIKLVAAPLYVWRRQVNGRILWLLSIGGIPGVAAGVILVGALNAKRYENLIFLIIGATVALVALYNLYRAIFRGMQSSGRDRSRWLPWIAAGIGAEVGFSSAGTGALGSVALLSMTTLSPAEVIGTDILFGLMLSLVGGGFHLSAGHYSAAVLWQLLAGGLAGVMMGASLASKLPARPLRIALSLLLSVLGVQLCWKAFG